jgi:hypothetical protein
MAEFRADSAALVSILAAIIRQAHVSVIGTATYLNGELWKVKWTAEDSDASLQVFRFSTSTNNSKMVPAAI